jgi:hypothetical protein
MQGIKLLCDTSKKVTSKLHKINNYISNYTSIIYMKVIQACVSWNANHREEDEDNVDTVIFLLRFARLPPSYVPVVSTNILCFSG